MHFPFQWKQSLWIITLIIWSGVSLGMLFLFLVAYPFIPFLGQGFLTGKTLVVITNENEARPCGGFATAYATIDFFPPKISLQDIYALQGESLGVSSFPLKKVSPELYFWDLGTSADVRQCLQSFHTHYEKLTGDTITNTVLVSFETFEHLIAIFEPLTWNETPLRGDSFFAILSRTVADIDRHDEASLATRKSPMKDIAKALFSKAITHPHLILKAAYVIRGEIKSGSLFVQGMSSDIVPTAYDFSFIEWNLGGGKSSRYLKKNLTLRLQESRPTHWTVDVQFAADNTAWYDAPLGQDWQGVFEIHMPEFLDQAPIFLETKIPAMGRFEKSWSFSYTGELKEFGIFVPRNNSLFVDMTLSFFPQKQVQSDILLTRENVAYLHDIFTNSQSISWEVVPDLMPPFITRHEVIPAYALDDLVSLYPEISDIQQSDLIVEIHFNEDIILGNGFDVSMKDRDWENKEITDHPVYTYALLLDDKRTLLLGFSQNNFQLHERFFVEVLDVYDLFKNRIVSAPRTVIDRRSKD